MASMHPEVAKLPGLTGVQRLREQAVALQRRPVGVETAQLAQLAQVGLAELQYVVKGQFIGLDDAALMMADGLGRTGLRNRELRSIPAGLAPRAHESFLDTFASNAAGRTRSAPLAIDRAPVQTIRTRRTPKPG